MKGKNTIIMNSPTIIEALQAYLDGMFVMNGQQIIAVKPEMSAYKEGEEMQQLYRVEVEEKALLRMVNGSDDAVSDATEGPLELTAS